MSNCTINPRSFSHKCYEHLQTAELLLNGVKDSLRAENDKWGIIPPEHSKESIKRRCVQARQELLMVMKELDR
jgi:hypothetical protein